MMGGTVVYKGVINYLRKVEKQSRFANAKALTETAKDVQKEEVRALHRYLDRPTKFTAGPSPTRGVFRIKYATVKRPIAAVYAAPIQEKYLQYQVFGGTNKGHVPGRKAKLNPYGNVSRNTLKAKPKNTFYATSRSGLYGLWKVTGRGKNKKLELVVHYPSSRKYRKRLPFFRVARETVGKRFSGNYRNEFKKAMRTAK